MIAITAEDESSAYAIQLTGIRIGATEPATYDMTNKQSIVLSASKTPDGNRWIVVSNTATSIDTNTYATKVYVNNMISRDTITNGTLTSGAVTVAYSLFGTGTPSLINPTQGAYELVIPANTDIRSVVVTGNNTTLTPSNGFSFAVDNNANALQHWFNVQLYDVSTNSLIDQHGTGTNHTQTVASNKTTMVFPQMNLFSTTGYRIILK